jgi:cytochrome c
MKFKSLVLPTIAGIMAFSNIAVAEDVSALARAKGCLACHSVDKKIVGPALKDIAAKYKGDAGAVDALAAKVKTGGKGVWGPIPMPPNATLSDDELKKLVGWILTQ